MTFALLLTFRVKYLVPIVMVFGRPLVIFIFCTFQLGLPSAIEFAEFNDPNRAKLWQGLRAAALGTGHWHATPKHLTSLLNSVPPGGEEYKYILGIIRELEALPRKSPAAHAHPLNAPQKPRSSIRSSVESGPRDWSQSHQPSQKLRGRRVQARREAAWDMTAGQANSASLQALRRSERAAYRRWERDQRRQQHQVNTTDNTTSQPRSYSMEILTNPGEAFMKEPNGDNSRNSFAMITSSNATAELTRAEAEAAGTTDLTGEVQARHGNNHGLNEGAALDTVNQVETHLGSKATVKEPTALPLNILNHRRVAPGAPCSGFSEATQRMRYRSARDAVLADIMRGRAKSKQDPNY